MQKYILKTENVDRNFPIAGREPVKVLKKVSVEIPEQTLTILRGPSGSGKTTLMNIIPKRVRMYWGFLKLWESATDRL